MLHILQRIAAPVNGRGSELMVLLLGHPHGGGRLQGCQNGSPDPRRGLALRWRDDSDARMGEGRHFRLHPLHDPGEDGVAPGQHGAGVQVLPDVHVAVVDGV